MSVITQLILASDCLGPEGRTPVWLWLAQGSVKRGHFKMIAYRGSAEMGLFRRSRKDTRPERLLLKSREQTSYVAVASVCNRVHGVGE